MFANNTIKSLSLPGLLPAGTLLYVLLAGDDDTGDDGLVSYHLLPSPYSLATNTSDGIDIFTINSTTGLLSLATDLSSQPYTKYLLHIEARDSGTVPKTALHKVLVEITNDSLPSTVFSKDFYTTSINENVNPGSHVLTVECSEVNSINSDFTELTIAIVSGNTNNIFTLDDSTITTQGTIDYEMFHTVTLNVSCSNSFDETAFTEVEIFVNNLDDNVFMFSSPSYNVSVLENASSPLVLATVSASDADRPAATIKYFITNNTLYGNLFSINTTTGAVAIDTSNPFDHETLDNYVVFIEAVLFDEDGSVDQTISTSLNISIGDVNDNPPRFSKTVYVVTNLTQQNSAPQTVLFTSATDKDSSDNGLFTFSIESNSFLDIDPDTGEVFITSSSLEKGVYEISVYATDQGAPPMTGTALLDILVRVSPDELHFSHTHYNFSLPEDSPLGVLVGEVNAVLYDIYSEAVEEGSAAAGIRYSFADGYDVAMFSLHSASGKLLMSLPADYETEPVHIFKIAANQPSFPSVPMATATVRVNVQDVNDNHPLFTHSAYSKVVDKGTSIGTSVLKVSASDEDEDGDQAVSYTMEEDHAQPFAINSTTGHIYVTDQLSPKDYHFVVMATDAGEPHLSSSATVHISVSKEATIHPAFNSTRYIFSVEEGGASIVGYVGGITDGNRSISEGDDIGIRTVSPGYSDTFDMPFMVGETSGEVTADPTFSFDTMKQDEFIFYVELFQLSEPDTTYDKVPVVVMVTDVNDHSPVFTEDHYSTYTSEATPSDTLLLTITATDDDLGLNGEITYSLTSDVLGFHIDPYSGDVTTVNASLQSGDYHMTVTATDKGAPFNQESIDLTVTVLESSDKVIFSNTSFSFTVEEGAAMGVVVGDVMVTTVTNYTLVEGDLTYALSPPPASDCISLDGKTLKISCTDLDREKQSLYSLVVEVTHTPSTASARVGVTITISDINDTPPLFNRDVYATHVFTPYNISYPPILTSATDEDSGANAAITYSIDSTDTAITTIFDISSSTGEIYLLSSNSSVIVGDHSFTVKAVNSNDNTQSDTALVLIAVLKQASELLAFSESSLIFSVQENTPGATEIGTIQLLAPEPIDPTDFIGELDLTILTGPDYFIIDDTTATLSLVNNFLDHEVADSHVLLVEAAFTTYNIKASAYITIQVLDVNDNAPVFTQSVYAAEVGHLAVTDTSVVAVQANDADTHDKPFSYYFLDDSITLFAIDGASGVITTQTTPLPVEHFKMMVGVSDNGDPPLNSTALVSIIVNYDVPESISFTSNTYTFSLVENAGIGVYVGGVAIQDSSPALDGLVFFFETPSDEALASALEDFHLDPVSGNITALVSIDYEEFSGGDFTVVAELPSESLTAEATVTIGIEDVNDNKPVFTKPLYTTSITQGDFDTDTALVTVQATDAESDNILYSITAGGENFQIDDDGHIKATSTDLGGDTYHLTVTGTDDGSPSLSSTTLVVMTIYVAIPSGVGFKTSSYTFNIVENTEPGEVVGVVELKAIDTSYVVDVQYNSSNANVAMVTSSDNLLRADVVVTDVFDYEETQSHTATVTATVYLTGTEQSSATTSTSITVMVDDINDNPPVFTNVPSDSISINENRPEGFLIITLTCTDADSTTLQYSLLNTYGGRFKVTKASNANAQVRTGATNIDREESTAFLLTVIATDDGSPSLSAAVTLFIIVTDINDNSPELVSGTEYHINEEQAEGDTLFTILAQDLDEDDNVIHFSLTGGPFEIESNGQVTSTRRLDYEDGDETFQLELEMDDGENVVEVDIVVMVLNVPDDEHPVFGPLPSEIRALSYEKNLLRVVATDGDGDSLTFTLSAGSSIFRMKKIDDNSAWLQPKLTPIPSNAPNVRIKVTDDSPYSISVTSKSIDIVVIESFQFSSSEFMFNTSESSSPNTIVGTLTLGDESIKQSSTFDLLSSSEHFRLTESAELELVQEVDRELQAVYILEATVTWEDRTDTTTITVIVIDENDNPPSFTSGRLLIVSHDTIEVGEIEVVDYDCGENAAVTFSTSDDRFSITSQQQGGSDDGCSVVTTGTITLVTTPLKNNATLTVVAVDNGQPPQSTTQTFTIVVTTPIVTKVPAVGGGGAIIGVAITSVLLVIAIIIIIILVVLTVVRRKEKVKQKEK